MSNVLSFIGIEEMKEWEIFLTQLFAEFLGTFLYISIVCLIETNKTYSVTCIAFANGLLVATIVQIIGNVSGGHLNPAITLGVLICEHIKLLKAICYIAVQAAASIAGAAVAYTVSEPSTRGKLGAIIPHPNLRAEQVFGLELLMTFMTVAVALSVTDPKRGGRGLGSAALAIGLSYTACQCACLRYTSSMNPVRSLGPAVVMNIWTLHWVYWAAPMAGAFLAGLVYRFVLNLEMF